MFCNERHDTNVSSHYCLHYIFDIIYFTGTIIKLHIFPIIWWNIEYSFLSTKQTHIGFYNFDRYYFIVTFILCLCTFFYASPFHKMQRMVPQWLFNLTVLQVKRNIFNHLFPLTKKAIASQTRKAHRQYQRRPSLKMSKAPQLNYIWKRASVGRFQPTARGFMWFFRASCAISVAPAGEKKIKVIVTFYRDK